MYFNKRISVVIPTLGGEQIYQTLEAINSSLNVPDEIIICIPELEATKLRLDHFSNVKICVSSIRGQVPQRALGFKVASGDFVIQLDDDLILEMNTISYLVEALSKLPINSAISPSIMRDKPARSFYEMPKSKFLLSLYYFILNGYNRYEQGKLTKAFTNVGVDPNIQKETLSKSEWLPGGCVIHNACNLIDYNYYPFSGKAYCEDIYHSLYLKDKGINLYFHNTAKIWLTDEVVNFSFKQKLNSFFSDYKARYYLIKKFPEGRSKFSFYCYYFINFFRLVFN